MAPSRSVLSLVGLAVVGLGCTPEPPPTPQLQQLNPQLAFIDESSCARCHPAEAAAWTGSHHDLAMQDVSEMTVLGDFSGVTFENEGVISTFRRDDERFLVETEGPTGELVEYEVSAVFGIEPLQQYLIDFPGGRKQALSIAWDTRAERWYHLYPDERIDHDDELHWTRRAQNWNWQCAECHATGLTRGWNAEAGGYDTLARRLDVGCQACHGPGSVHEARAELGSRSTSAVDSGLLEGPSSKDSARAIETCARCHARRAPLGDGWTHDNRLMDDYLPALLTEGLYHADGKILDEVYVYGSFLQSKMHAKGVRCSDCHDPHSARLRAPGNATCTVCHSLGGPGARPHVDTSGLQRKDYDSPAHHFHAANGPGSACVDCHAPARTYMVVDPRRDHSFRIPRPDISAKLGTPDACTGCHEDQTPSWAAERVAHWYGDGRRQEPHPGEAIHASREGLPGAAEGLLSLLADSEVPAIFRATALGLLARYPSEQAVSSATASLADREPLVRHAAMRALDDAPLDAATRLFGPLLDDPVRAVRMAAARRLASSRPESKALKEWVASQEALGGQPEASLALGALARQQGRSEEALRLMERALALDPSFVPAALNLADLHAALGDEGKAELTLRAGLKHSPGASLLQHSLGLALVRQGRRVEGLAELGRAARNSPDDPRLGFVHAVALHDAGQLSAAVAELERVVEAVPWARDARLTLVGWLRGSVNMERARGHLDQLGAINPFDPTQRQSSIDAQKTRPTKK